MQTPDRGPQLEAAIILFLCLSWVTVILRCYVRIRIIRCFAIDDYLTLITLCLFTIYGGLVLRGVYWGSGRHMKDLTIRQQWNAMQIWYFGELFYVISTTFLRLAAGYFLLRVALRKTHRYIIHFCNTVNLLFNIYFFFFTMFQCDPIDYWWTRVDGIHTGKCLSQASADSTYAQSALSALIDWTYGILPIFMVWDLNMNRKKKLLVAMVLSLAALASAATIVRLPYVYTLAHSEDFLWDTQPVAIWSSVEPGIGITAISLATLRPLFRSFLIRLGVSTADTAAHRYGFSASNTRPKQPPRSGSGGATSPFKKADVKHDPFEDDEELQLRGIRLKMGNSSHVEAGLQTAPSRKTLNGWSPLCRAEKLDGPKATWYKGDSKATSTRTSEDEINVTKTMHVSACHAGNGNTKVFVV